MKERQKLFEPLGPDIEMVKPRDVWAAKYELPFIKCGFPGLISGKRPITSISMARGR